MVESSLGSSCFFQDFVVFDEPKKIVIASK